MAHNNLFHFAHTLATIFGTWLTPIGSVSQRDYYTHSGNAGAVHSFIPCVRILLYDGRTPAAEIDAQRGVILHGGEGS